MTPARKLVCSLTELIKSGVLQLSLQDMERLDKGTMDRAQLVSLVDEFDDQKLEYNATKNDLLKLRNTLAVQHQAIFKQVVAINKKTTKHDKNTSLYNQKMKTILLQVDELLTPLDQSLLKRSEADSINNKSIRRVISDISEI